MLLFVNSFAHLLVDAVCAAAIFGAQSPSGLTNIILYYNTLAFSTQCLAGLFADRFGRLPYMEGVSMLLVILGFALPVPLFARVCLIGAGNSVFHASGGAVTLRRSGGKAGPLGIFVAPGCIGLTLGTLYPSLGPVFAALLAVCCLLIIPIGGKASDREVLSQCNAGAERVGISISVLLTLAVAVRAVGGSAVSFPWKSGAGAAMLMTVFIFAGKAAGGYVCDRLGTKPAALLSVPLAAVLIAFFPQHMLPSLVGQFALNLTMPLTLLLLYRAMPSSPGFAFGLAASALWPGTIAGRLMTLTGPALWLCVIISFVFGLWAILLSEKRLSQKNCSGKDMTSQ